jgi:hypothetical protein
MALRQTALIAGALYALTAFTLSAQGYGHGTAEAVITSSDAIVAAIDSKEVNREYLSDGTSVTQDRIACKVRQIGPYYVLIAGISRATDGFDALLEAKRWYRSDDSLDSFAERLAIALPKRLSPVMDTLRAASGVAFDESFRNQDVLQLTLLGAERNKPRVVMVTLHASQSGVGLVSIAARFSSCPGSCTDPHTVYLSGVHDEADRFLRNNPDEAREASTKNALRLIGLEYASHPDVVGGLASVVRVSSGGVVLEQAGACADDAGLPRLQDELDLAIAAVADVVVDEDVTQYSQRGQKLHSNAIHGKVRVIGGNEEYAWVGHDYQAGRPPEPWCGGELATMMRITRLELRRPQGALSSETLAPRETELVVAFHATAAERYWQLMVGSRTYPLAFDGRAWFSQATGKLTRIRWEATDLTLPAGAGITKIEWDETFSPIDIAGHSVLTPTAAIYRVSYSRNVDRSDWTETRFVDFRRFGATESVQFVQIGYPGVPPKS